MPIISGGGGGSGALSSSLTQKLAAPVTMVNSAQFYDAVSISCAAGTWFVSWQMCFQDIVTTAQSNAYTGRLWDGTTTYSEAEIDSASAINAQGFAWSVAGSALIVLAVTTTLKISGANSHGSSAGQINSDPVSNSSGAHVATQMTGLKVA